MRVTRDVIYDLLPGYFAGELSPDTRALVDEFLEQDPEFRRMMERFRTVFSDKRSAAAVTPPGATATFERARMVLHKRSELRGYVIAFGIAGLFVFFVAMQRMFILTPSGPWFIAMAFFATSVIAGYQLYRLKSDDAAR